MAVTILEIYYYYCFKLLNLYRFNTCVSYKSHNKCSAIKYLTKFKPIKNKKHLYFEQFIVISLSLQYFLEETIKK